MYIVLLHAYTYTCMFLMRDEKEGRKKQARSNKQKKAKKHSTPKAVTFPKKNELPRVGLEPTTLYTLDRVDRVLYHRATKAAQLVGPKSNETTNDTKPQMYTITVSGCWVLSVQCSTHISGKYMYIHIYINNIMLIARLHVIVYTVHVHDRCTIRVCVMYCVTTAVIVV